MKSFDLTSQVISSRIVDVKPCYFGPDLLGICNGSEVLVLSSKTGEVYAPKAQINKLKSTPKGRRKLAAANRKKRAATKAGKQHARHGLHKGKKR